MCPPNSKTQIVNILGNFLHYCFYIYIKKKQEPELAPAATKTVFRGSFLLADPDFSPRSVQMKYVSSNCFLLFM